MSEAQRKILEMLSQGKIAVEEAERLLQAVSTGEEQEQARAGKLPRYLHVRVETQGGEGDRVNVRVPLQLLRAGVRLAAVMPAVAKEKMGEALDAKGIRLDLDKIRPEDIEELLKAVEDLTIDVNEGREKIRIYCE